MSTDFVTSRKDIPFNELVERLLPFGITAVLRGGKGIVVTDNEHGSIWANEGKDGMLCALTCYAGNGMPGKILGAIRKAFDTQIAICDGYKIEFDLAGEPWKG
jgi:hypothetical protein